MPEEIAVWQTNSTGQLVCVECGSIVDKTFRINHEKFHNNLKAQVNPRSLR